MEVILFHVLPRLWQIVVDAVYLGHKLERIVKNIYVYDSLSAVVVKLSALCLCLPVDALVFFSW